MSKVVTFRKFDRVRVFVKEILGGIVLSIMGWLILTLIFLHTGDYMYGVWLTWGMPVYALTMICLIVRNAVHKFRWYILRSPIDIQCPNCRTSNPLTRYGEERLLTVPIAIYLNFRTLRYNLYRSKLPIYRSFCRPYLQLTCSVCGAKQVICPYCHEQIPQESVECFHDKTSLCPHCGKKIYTPLPPQDFDESIMIVELTN